MISAIAAVALAPALAQDPYERRPIGDSGLHMELPGALIAMPEATRGAGIVEHETFSTLDIETGLSGTIHYEKRKEVLLEGTNLQREKERIKREHPDSPVTEVRQPVIPFDATLLSFTYQKGGDTHRQFILRIFNVTELWRITADVRDTIEGERKAMRWLKSAQFGGTRDWGNWRLDSARLNISLAGSPAEQQGGSLPDYWSTGSKWVGVMGDVDVYVTYLKAKEGLAIAIESTFDNIRKAASLEGEEVITVSRGGASGKLLTASYEHQGRKQMVSAMILLRGTEGWDIRVSGPPTLLNSRIMSYIADSVSPHSADDLPEPR